MKFILAVVAPVMIAVTGCAQAPLSISLDAAALGPPRWLRCDMAFHSSDRTAQLLAVPVADTLAKQTASADGAPRLNTWFTPRTRMIIRRKADRAEAIAYLDRSGIVQEVQTLQPGAHVSVSSQPAIAAFRGSTALLSYLGIQAGARLTVSRCTGPMVYPSRGPT